MADGHTQLSGKPVAWNLHGLPKARMDGVHNSKIVYRNHRLLARGGAWLVLSLVWTMLIPYQDGLIPHHLFDVYKPVLLRVDGRLFV